MNQPLAKPIVTGQPLDLRRAFIRRTTLDGADLRGANLREADLTNASARFTDFTGAILDRTILRGADLTGAILTPNQLRTAIVDETTRLPDGLAGEWRPPARATPRLSYGLETWRAVVLPPRGQNQRRNNARTCALPLAAKAARGGTPRLQRPN